MNENENRLKELMDVRNPEQFNELYEMDHTSEKWTEFVEFQLKVCECSSIEELSVIIDDLITKKIIPPDQREEVISTQKYWINCREEGCKSCEYYCIQLSECKEEFCNSCPCNGCELRSCEHKSKLNIEGQKNHKIWTILGSTKYRKEIKQFAWELTIQGCLVHFAPFAKEENKDLEDYRDILESIHFQKIRNADLVFVYNKEKYIGKSTRAEIDYATKLGKKIGYLE